MTYSIIPPILVVLSVIGIILFLMKKAPKIATLREKNDFTSRLSEKPQNGSVKGLVSKDKYLLVMEKMTRRFKIGLIKMEKKFSTWNESIRKKRKENGTTQKEESGREAEIINTQPDVPTNIAINANSNGDDIIIKRRANMLGSEKPIRPIVSEKMAPPKVKVEIKDRLEKLLIERIAANPKDIEAYERLGEYYFEIGNLEYSKDCFKQVIKLDPGNINAKSKMRRLENLLGR